MTSSSTMLVLVAQTSIHAGVSSSVGTVDLPIQRGCHSGRSCIFGSAVKGALRTRAEDYKVSWLASVFGSNTNGAGDHAGAICVVGARLLLFPVRSLTSTFRWVTCPDVLRRLQRDAELLRLGLNIPIHLPIEEGQALVHQGCDDLFLEELRISAQQIDLSNLIESLLPLVGQERQTELEKRLTIISDDHFDVLCRYATPMHPHIAIDNATKNAASGALWYVETLPPESVLYLPLIAHPVRFSKQEMSASEVLDNLTGLFVSRPWLQLGGNANVGMGWFNVNILSREEG
uniref:Putative CRISPR-associated RAMP protein, Cmr4 family n=1 Tax=Candidatus Nitrotoga fabula TaxID=2182327 RepID=A0A2X0QXC2_9PROT|nr:putative CRISPR-associated RAMP protein, Cmr4 family [Candidatus Nitrotoga fabula]